MTLPELEAAIAGQFGEMHADKPIARDDLNELMQRFPDQQEGP